MPEITSAYIATDQVPCLGYYSAFDKVKQVAWTSCITSWMTVLLFLFLLCEVFNLKRSCLNLACLVAAIITSITNLLHWRSRTMISQHRQGTEAQEPLRPIAPSRKISGNLWTGFHCRVSLVRRLLYS